MEILIIGLLTVVASMIGAVAGFGTSTIIIPALLLFLPFPVAIFLAAIIRWFGNIWKIALFRKGLKWELALLFAVPAAITSAASALFVFRIPEHILSQTLGVFLLLYVFFLLLHPSSRLPRNRIISIVGGALSGFFVGLFGIGGPVRSVFLSAFDLWKISYIAISGLIGLVADSSRLVVYIHDGATLPHDILWGIVVFAIASFVGVEIGRHVVTRVPQQYFRYLVLVFLFVAGVKLLFF